MVRAVRSYGFGGAINAMIRASARVRIVGLVLDLRDVSGHREVTRIVVDGVEVTTCVPSIVYNVLIG